MPFVINGTTGINLATQPLTGALPDANAPSGSVIQIVQATYSTQVTSTSATYATTGLSASITPTSSSNRIAIFAMVSYQTLGINAGLGLAIYRNGSVLWNPSVAFSGGSYGAGYGSSTALNGLIPVNYIDSPSTTSATTYAMFFASYNSTGIRVQPADTVNNGQSSIILMEIAA